MAPSSLSLGVLFTAFLAAFLGITLHTFYVPKSKNGGEYTDMEACKLFDGTNVSGECFFRDDYHAARDLFLTSATEAGAELIILPVVGDLCTDIAVLRGTGPSRGFLVHLSGIHGPEGYAGSAVQSAALQYLSQLRKKHIQPESPHTDIISEEDEENLEERSNNENEYRKTFPTIVFVHAVNPYGFANNRRVNEANVDLNRNFLTELEFASVRARDPNYAGYVDLDSLINPTKTISTNQNINDIHNAIKAFYAITKYGILHIKRALVSGNYFNEKGVGFGGFSLQPSSKNLIDLINAEWLGLFDAEQIVLVDVHTGLGPQGVDTLMSNPTSALKKYYPNEINYGISSEEKVVTENGTVDASNDDKTGEEKKKETKKENRKKTVITGGLHADSDGGGNDNNNDNDNDNDALSGYDLTVGQTTTGFCETFLSQHLSQDKITCVLQEFGTVSPVIIGRTMIAENYAHFYGTDDEKKIFTDRYKDCFYVNTHVWKRNIVRRGLKVFLQSMILLGADTDQLPIPTFQL